ncbi:hypothetical protein BJ546DRAFT_968695 [Cryomyces antarcticus]|uniref:Mitochondrial pyruvate carrier n=1 Tax=Cryomyces antarcticus TaxID=329879 RepID=A0ABR0M0U8_9PEZI|nr:hypothetical protein LTR60_002181 [Cryomyces antarcticus]KAK5017438.1 hypothetical protein LTR39_001543 [Cryomyces antarcticus]KAK5256710.1 hypothetical protein LTR16_002588 [Cryomyces antarcticus]
MSSRFGLRFFQNARQSMLRSQQRFASSSPAAGTNAVPPNPAAGNAGQGRVAQLWNSPVGPKTVHFWAPVMKWGLVLAGVSDFARPAESLSLSQNVALMATGLIWTRWCFVIKPRNIFLASVNFLLFCVGATQISRIFLYHQSLKDSTLAEEAKKAAKEEGHIIEGMVKDPQGALKRAEKA